MNYTDNSMLLDYVKGSIEDSICAKEAILNDESMLNQLVEIGSMIHRAVTSGGKVLLCGNGGSAADAQHIAAEIVGRFVIERRGLAAIALTTDSSILTAVGNDYGFDAIFSRQVEALAQRGDILIGITTSGNSANVVAAINMAKQMGVTTIGMLGGSGGKAAEICDRSIVVRSNTTARVQESHILCGHILCGVVDAIIGAKPKQKAIFLDRDNTIIVDKGYMHRVESLEFIEGAISALSSLQSAGFKLVVITNQSGIGRGYFTECDYNTFNKAMLAALAVEGVIIDDVEFCPHSPDQECRCRKPYPYMVERAAARLGVDISASYMLGDKPSDVKCGENAGVRGSYLITAQEDLQYWARRIITENE